MVNVEVWKNHLPEWLVEVKEIIEIDWHSDTTDPKSIIKINNEFEKVFDRIAHSAYRT